MKRIIAVLLIMTTVFLLAACSCEHSWKDATCTDPKTCTQCGISEGKALGHYYYPATCTKAETCSRCGYENGVPKEHVFVDATCTQPSYCETCDKTKGEPLGHDYVDNVCTRCEGVDPESLPVGLNELPVIDYEYGYEYSDELLEDNFGNVYSGYHLFEEHAFESYAIFHMNFKYKKFICDFVTSSNQSRDMNATIQFYVDDKLVYEKKGIKKTTGPVHIEIDVENGRQLKIRGLESSGSYAEVGYIVNAQLYKK